MQKITELINEEFKERESLSGNWESYEVKDYLKEIQTSLISKIKAINFSYCCAELKTVKQGENLILDNEFDVEVIAPESSVLIKHKDKDRLIWVDKQRLKRKQFLITYNVLDRLRFLTNKK